MQIVTSLIQSAKQRESLIRVALSVMVGVGIGWRLCDHHFELRDREPVTSQPLRLSGYNFISPLLLCDSYFDQNSASLKIIETKILQYLDTTSLHETNSTISVYFRYLNTGEEFSINPEEKFFPASIKKLPLMIQYYKESETNPSLLSETGTFIIDKDMNSDTINIPKEALVSGNKYTIEQLIEYMIKYSDNNSFGVLYPFLGAEKADKIYADMKLYFPNTYTSTEDYITAYQVSLFFRMLYNATYLNYTNSEKALNLLSQADFKDGLVKKLPDGVPVAHKFGISAMKRLDNKLYGELHDCGIVYKKDNPYILCVMTKSQSSDIASVEDIVAEISSITYQQATR